MYYLYNPDLLLYVAKKKSRFYVTRDYRKACSFDNEFAATNIIVNNNLAKNLPGRDNFIVKHCEGDVLLPPKCPTEQEINKQTNFSFDELEEIIKQNERKIKTANTYLKNVYESTKKMEKTLSLLDNKIVLIYHYIESGDYAEEEKAQIFDLLNRTLMLRRSVKKQRAIFAFIETSTIFENLSKLVNKLKPFEYWDYEGTENFIKTIEEGNDIIK